MKLKSIKANCHELHLDNGSVVLFSYETPVTISVPFRLADGPHTYLGVYKTNVKHSVTTSRHVNAWTATTQVLSPVELDYLIRLASAVIK